MAKVKVTQVFGPGGAVVHIPSALLNNLIRKADSFSMVVENGLVKINYTSGTARGTMELKDVPPYRRAG